VRRKLAKITTTKKLKEAAKEAAKREKPHECQLCDEKFARTDNLKRHVLSKVSAGEAVVCACD
jgi:uncharacterized Zn-finger protein